MKRGARRTRFLCGAAIWSFLAPAVFATATAPAALRFVEPSQISGAMRVIDVRAENLCTKGSLPGARCLPASELFDGEGRPVSFHVLRWLLGTVGLTGHEQVLVVAEHVADATAVGGLLILAGEHEVAVLERPVAIPADAPGGNPRSTTRETVFTAPMRDRLLATGTEATGGSLIDAGRPFDRLRTFARRYADGMQPMQLRLFP